eukprot:4352005-Pyramimonas_sp.AAC.1
MAEHLRAGAAAWMEHPARALWAPRAPTSFRWPPLAAVASAQCAATCVFDQCEHQAPDSGPASFGGGPTCIVSIRMPTLYDELRNAPGQVKCPHGPGAHRSLLGGDGQG